MPIELFKNVHIYRCNVHSSVNCRIGSAPKILPLLCREKPFDASIIIISVVGVNIIKTRPQDATEQLFFDYGLGYPSSLSSPPGAQSDNFPPLQNNQVLSLSLRARMPTFVPFPTARAPLSPSYILYRPIFSLLLSLFSSRNFSHLLLLQRLFLFLSVVGLRDGLALSFSLSSLSPICEQMVCLFLAVLIRTFSHIPVRPIPTAFDLVREGERFSQKMEGGAEEETRP